MSEYQYYEFQTIDRLLDAEQMAYLHTLSRRAQVSSSHAIYNYSYGDFPADPLKVLKEHFDAFLYLSNWGSKQLVFRFPQNAFNPAELKAYWAFDEMSLESSGDYLILDIGFYPEDGGGEWIEGEGLLSSLVPLRNDIMAGDLRALYLVWLQAAVDYEMTLSYDDEMEDDEEDVEESDEKSDEDEIEHGSEAGDPDLVEPPLPPGLQQLTPPLRALIEFLELDPDLVTAAAQASPPWVAKSEPFEEWVTKLPMDERNAFLVRVARRDPRVPVDLLTRLREVGQEEDAVVLTSQPRRRFAEIKAAARAERERRQQKERQAAERKRLAELDKLAKRENEAWQEVAELLAKRRGSGYDAGVALLAQLRDLAVHRKQRAAFDQQLGEVAGPFLKSEALRQRMRAQHLIE